MRTGFIFYPIWIAILALLWPTLAAKGDNWPEGTTPFAKTELTAKSGSSVKGVVEFAHAGQSLVVRGEFSNLTPGNHGVHLHQIGNCSSPDASSAGDHFDFSPHKHGGPNAEARHAGDLGNLVADKDGNAKLLVTVRAPKAKEFTGWNAIVGKSFVVHEKADDFKTQPSGNSGARVACGEVRAVGIAAE